jgi:hypothetical protein
LTPNCYGADLPVSTIENRDACGFKINTSFIQNSTNLFAAYAW